MRLIKPQLWATRHFDEASRPTPDKLRRWMRDKVVPARKVGGEWFIDEDQWLAAGDPLVEHILTAGG